MLISRLIPRIKEIQEKYPNCDLQVTCNKINGKCFLIFRDEIEVVECLLIHDKKPINYGG